MPFVKLDCAILRSSLWLDRDAREIFLTALLLATPRHVKETMRQIAIGTLEYTGFEVPPGWYGFAEAAGPGLIHCAGVAAEAGLAALRRLSEPDADSRSQKWGGRRIARVDGGFIVLNYMDYRDHDYSAAERMAGLRERRRNATCVTRNVPPVHPNVTQAEAEAEAETTTATYVAEATMGDAVEKPTAPQTRKPHTADGFVFEALRAQILIPKLNPEDVAKAAALLFRASKHWTGHTLGALWYAADQEPPVRDVATFAYGCAKGKSGAREDFEGYRRRAEAFIRSCEHRADAENAAQGVVE